MRVPEIMPCPCNRDAERVEVQPSRDRTILETHIYRCPLNHTITVQYPAVHPGEVARRMKPTTPPPFPGRR